MRIRNDDQRLGQQLINKVYTSNEKPQDVITNIFYMEDEEFLKLIFN